MHECSAVQKSAQRVSSVWLQRMSASEGWQSAVHCGIAAVPPRGGMQWKARSAEESSAVPSMCCACCWGEQCCAFNVLCLLLGRAVLCLQCAVPAAGESSAVPSMCCACCWGGQCCAFKVLCLLLGRAVLCLQGAVPAAGVRGPPMRVSMEVSSRGCRVKQTSEVWC